MREHWILPFKLDRSRQVFLAKQIEKKESDHRLILERSLFIVSVSVRLVLVDSKICITIYLSKSLGLDCKGFHEDWVVFNRVGLV